MDKEIIKTQEKLIGEFKEIFEDFGNKTNKILTKYLIFLKSQIDDKVCPSCGETKKSNPTPDGDEICVCGEREMLDKE